MSTPTVINPLLTKADAKRIVSGDATVRERRMFEDVRDWLSEQDRESERFLVERVYREGRVSIIDTL